MASPSLHKVQGNSPLHLAFLILHRSHAFTTRLRLGEGITMAVAQCKAMTVRMTESDCNT